MLQSFMAMIVVTLLWVVVGFSLSFGSTIGGFIGDPTRYFMFQNVNINTWGTIPFMLFALFQAKFCNHHTSIDNRCLRRKNSFWAYMLFMVLFILLYTLHCVI
jgi:Amt family ammonium transporter